MLDGVAFVHYGYIEQQQKNCGVLYVYWKIIFLILNRLVQEKRDMHAVFESAFNTILYKIEMQVK